MNPDDFLNTFDSTFETVDTDKLLENAIKDKNQPVASTSSAPIEKKSKKTNKSTFTHSKNVILVRGPFKGYYGFVTDFFPKKYVVNLNGRTVIINNNNINQQGIILKGPFKNQKGSVVEELPAHLSVYIDSKGKNVIEHVVTEGDVHKIKKITPDDVFYMDIKLKNGNLFQVNQIREYGNIQGTEMLANNTFAKRTIQESDVDHFLTGFSMKVVKHEIISYKFEEPHGYDSEDEEPSYIPSNTDDYDPIVYHPDDSSDTFSGDEGEEFTLEEMDTSAELGTSTSEQDNFQHSFKDVERTNFNRELNGVQKEIQRKINSILACLSLNDDTIDAWEAISIVQNAFKETKRQLNESEFKNKWNKSDENYIIACIVLSELTKRNMFQGSFNLYIEKLLKCSLTFKMSDIKNSYFVKSGWSKAFTVDSENIALIIQHKNLMMVVTVILQHCFQVLVGLGLLSSINFNSSAQSTFSVLPVNETLTLDENVSYDDAKVTHLKKKKQMLVIPRRTSPNAVSKKIKTLANHRKRFKGLKQEEMKYKLEATEKDVQEKLKRYNKFLKEESDLLNSDLWETQQELEEQQAQLQKEYGRGSKFMSLRKSYEQDKLSNIRQHLKEIESSAKSQMKELESSFGHVNLEESDDTLSDTEETDDTDDLFGDD